MPLQETHAGEVAKLKEEMHTKEEEWKAEKAKMDSIARDADRKHQQLADRTALVDHCPYPPSQQCLCTQGSFGSLEVSGFFIAGAGQAAILCKAGSDQCTG